MSTRTTAAERTSQSTERGTFGDHSGTSRGVEDCTSVSLTSLNGRPRRGPEPLEALPLDEPHLGVLDWVQPRLSGRPLAVRCLDGLVLRRALGAHRLHYQPRTSASARLAGRRADDQPPAPPGGPLRLPKPSLGLRSSVRLGAKPEYKVGLRPQWIPLMTKKRFGAINAATTLLNTSEIKASSTVRSARFLHGSSPPLSRSGR